MLGSSVIKAEWNREQAGRTGQSWRLLYRNRVKCTDVKSRHMQIDRCTASGLEPRGGTHTRSTGLEQWKLFGECSTDIFLFLLAGLGDFAQSAGLYGKILCYSY